jgi:hypothetical protein
LPLFSRILLSPFSTQFISSLFFCLFNNSSTSSSIFLFYFVLLIFPCCFQHWFTLYTLTSLPFYSWFALHLCLLLLFHPSFSPTKYHGTHH